MFFHPAVLRVADEDLRSFTYDDNVCAANNMQRGSFNEHGGISQGFERRGHLPCRARASNKKPGDSNDEFPVKMFSTPSKHVRVVMCIQGSRYDLTDLEEGSIQMRALQLVHGQQLKT